MKLTANRIGFAYGNKFRKRKIRKIIWNFLWNWKINWNTIKLISLSFFLLIKREMWLAKQICKAFGLCEKKKKVNWNDREICNKWFSLVCLPAAPTPPLKIQEQLFGRQVFVSCFAAAASPAMAAFVILIRPVVQERKLLNRSASALANFRVVVYIYARAQPQPWQQRQRWGQ